ncbi:tetratricopeptide repeat protein [Gemmatimonas sp.]|uniref:tetratricopeptide repeat protein n=1 Tax=Gemmatimonas sp. TaxID=1962908 RepID=UPI00356AA461
MTARGARAAVLLGALVAMSVRTAASKASPQPSPIDRALAAGQWHEAVRMLDSALANIPRDAARLQQRGRAHRELEEFEQALADYTQAISEDRRFAAAYAGRAIVHQRLGNAKASFADIDSARALGMKDPQLDLVEGMGHMMSNDGAKAWEHFDAYVRALPDAAQGWLLRGRAAGMTGRGADAERDFTAAIQRRMTGPEVYTLRAIARAALGNTAGACADLAEAVKLGDKSAAATVTKNCR